MMNIYHLINQKSIKKNNYFCRVIIGASIFLNFINLSSITLETIYGNFTITEPILCELLACPTVQRMGNIHQYGVIYYTVKPLEYDRYTHSIGVLALLIKYNAPLLEQIAGLLHDVSHTVFSHVADYIYNEHHDSYQDKIHQWFLEQTEIPAILKKYNISLESILHKENSFKCLERNLPDMCADRLEYNLYGGFIEHYLTPDDIEMIMNSLHFEHHHWYFSDISAAKKVALTSLKLTQNHFGSDWNFVINYWAAQVLKKALELKTISLHDLHFSIDDPMWQLLCQHEDEEIKLIMHKIVDHKNHYIITDQSHYDLHYCPKFRGINPWIETEDGLQRLTDLDTDYEREFTRVKNMMQHGWYIKFK